MKRLLPLAVVLVLAVGCGSSQQASGPCTGGGSAVVLKALPGNGQLVTSAGMKIAARVMTARLERLGLSSPTVTVAGDEITIQSAGLPAKNISLVASGGELQFFDFEKDLASPTVKNGMPTPFPTLYKLLLLFKGLESQNGVSAYYLFGPPAKGSGLRPVLGGPAPTRKDLLAPYSGKKRPGMTFLSVPRGLEVVSGPAETAATQPVENSPDGVYWYLFRLPPPISANDVKKSAILADRSMSDGQPEVQAGFTRNGAKAFEAITKAEYDRGQVVAGLHGSAGTFNVQYVQHNAIVLDGKLEALPYINYTDPVLSLGIAGGAAVIGDMGSMTAAKNLALVLKSGSLPYAFQRVSVRSCSS